MMMLCNGCIFLFNWRTLVKTLLAILLVVSIVASPIVQAYSAHGRKDWVVDEDTLVEGIEINVKGNIVVKSGAKLTLVDSIIYMNCGYSGEFSIIVEKGAVLELFNTTVRSGTGKPYLFIVHGTLVMKKSLLRDCGITQDKPGLIIEGSSYTIIKNSVIKGNYVGITVRKSRNIEIVGNKITANTYGIYIVNSKDIVVHGNKFTTNLYDLYTYNSTSITISNNYFEGGGLYMDRNIGNVIKGNVFKNTGVMLSGDKVVYYKHRFVDNIVNNKPLLYVYNKSKIITGDIGMAIIVSSNNVVVHNVTVHDTIIGLGLYFSNNITISNSIIEKNKIGIEIKFSKEITILGCMVRRNEMYGLKIYSSRDISIKYNNITYNSLSGVLVMDSFNVSINYNNFTKNKGYGVCVQDSKGVDAKYNWWGSIQGPENKLQSDPDDPDEVYSFNTHDFTYEPWLQEPVETETIRPNYTANTYGSEEENTVLNTTPYIASILILAVAMDLIRQYYKMLKTLA